MTRSVRADHVERRWWVVDAAGQTLGRLASRIATLIRGKHKPSFTAHVDCGDYVIVVNAEKVILTGKRPEQKQYFRYTGYPGGARFDSFRELIEHNPAAIIEHAVYGMLPKNRLGRRMRLKLKVYAGPNHPHHAQKPESYPLTSA
ncbi:MAG: 50S ribosomal protein L13 [Chlorobi bacterium]|nr:50S ribosomal protein L13 [Chlorobiota bacterium]